MDAVGIKAADRDDLLDIGDADLARGRGWLVEVAAALRNMRLPASSAFNP
jgi:hypothetical protein